MTEYIKREDALNIVKRTSGDYVAAWKCIDNLPSIDIAPAVHGKWIKQKCQGDYGLCSECNCRIPWIPKNYKYCPNCGARMDGGADNETD